MTAANRRRDVIVKRLYRVASDHYGLYAGHVRAGRDLPAHREWRKAVKVETVAGEVEEQAFAIRLDAASREAKSQFGTGLLQVMRIAS